MYRLSFRLFLSLAITVTTLQSSAQQKVFTSDIDNFWLAYDSIRSTSDSLKQLQFIQTLYIDKGTEGLHAFMKARDYSAPHWVQLIRRYPKFWNSIRPNTLGIKAKTAEIEESIIKLHQLYPRLKDAKMYFTIGGLRSGGTVDNNLVLIGAEIVTGNAATDVSEFPDKWLAGVFKASSADNMVALNIHEYIHTQQRGKSTNLLSQAIREGSCDFITELVIGKPLQTQYINYGNKHRQELKEKFKDEMFTSAFSRWLYNGSNAETVADLGYFMGYDISKAYYNYAKNKKKAIREIIELNYSREDEVEKFLKKANYYAGSIDKAASIKAYEAKQPVLMKMEPFENGSTSVDTSVKELVLIFSKPMYKGYSINYSDKGKDYSPISGISGYSEDKNRFILNLSLQPNKEYEFVVTNSSFKSTDGYPLLKSYTIKFKTR
jgi:hypothetical protein